jgi:hypothetical protein
MAVITTQDRITYAGDNVSTVLTVPFEFFLASDLLVLKQNAATGAYATMALGTDYTAQNAGNAAGGSITTAVPIVVGYNYTIILAPTLTQQSNYPSNSPFPSSTLQNDMDRHMQIDQRLQDQISRSIRAPDADVNPAMLLPGAAARALTNLGFDASGNIMTFLTLMAGVLSAASIGSFLYPALAGEGATVVQGWYPYGVPDRYQVNTVPGTTDMAPGWRKALAGVGYCLPGPGPYLIGSTIALTGQQMIIGMPGGENSFQTSQVIHSPASTGPLFTSLTNEFFGVYIGHLDISGGNGSYCIANVRAQSVFEWLHIEAPTLIAVAYNGGGIQLLTGLLTFTVAPLAGATNATLNAPFIGPTGVYTVTFNTGESRAVTLTNGATTATWATGLTSNETTAANYGQGSWECILRDNKHVASAPPSGGLATNAFRSYQVGVNGGNTLLEHCNSTYASVGIEIIQGQGIILSRCDFNSDGVYASDSTSQGQCGIRMAGTGYKQNIAIKSCFIEGCITSIWMETCNNVTIKDCFIDDLGNTNIPAVYLASAAAQNVKLDTNWIQVRNSAGTVACVSNAGVETFLENNTFNANNALATQHTIINSAAAVLLNNQNAATNFGTVSDPSNLLQDITPAGGAIVPTIAGSTTAGVQTYSLNSGYWWRIGRRIFYDIVIIMTAKDGATAGNLQVTGLPVASRNNAAGRIYNATIGGHSNFTFTAGNQLSATVANNGTTITLFQNGTGLAQAALAAAALNATSAIYLSGSYDV